MFGDEGKAREQDKLEEIRRNLEAAPSGKNPRRWTKYYREQLAEQERQLLYVNWLFANYDTGQWSTDDEEQINQLAGFIHGDETRRADNHKRIQNNEGNIRQWRRGGLEQRVSGYGEQVIARLTRENLARQEAERRSL